jgi:TonB family protein
MPTSDSPASDPELDFLKIQNVSDVGLWASLRANLRDAFASPRLRPLRLTSRPLTRKEMLAVGDETVNLARLQEVNDRSLLGRIWEDLRPAPHLPPLQLTSRPVRVRNLWGFYDYRRPGAVWSAVVHVLLIGALLTVSWAGLRTAKAIVPQTQPQEVTLLAPAADQLLPLSRKKNDTLAGGGGGGDRDKLPAPKGKLPKFSMQQITPPAVVIRNTNPKLSAEPTVVMPPDVKLPLANNMPNLGDPLSKVTGPPSNGTGSGGGIGSGRGGGVGSGSGGGVGPGSGGGYGGGVFKVGGGVSAPRVIDAPDPDYSEEARKAKYQGTCVLWLIVGPDGIPRDLRVVRTLGMGLDEKAMQAVRRWRFEPARMNGRPVAVQISVEVNFHLY